MSCSRQVQILYRADAFLIGYLNTACPLKPCEHDAGELMGMLHAHVSAAQNLVMWCLGDKHMLHRCVFFQYRTGRQCVMDKFIHLFQVRPSSSLPLMCVPNSWQRLKGLLQWKSFVMTMT